ncbi:MAG: lipocalin family protein [Rhodanobacteraceae bacterium]
MRIARFLLVCTAALLSVSAFAGDLAPIKPVTHVDLPRFMGKWYLVAAIPTHYGKKAYNAVETYTLQSDGHIHTTFRFNNGGFDGPLKHIESTAYVRSGTGNAVWGVQLFWPFKLQYIVAWLKPDYSRMIVARDKRDYVWVFARTPNVSEADYHALITEVAKLGYDLARVRRVPQKWP